MAGYSGCCALPGVSGFEQVPVPCQARHSLAQAGVGYWRLLATIERRVDLLEFLTITTRRVLKHGGQAMKQISKLMKHVGNHLCAMFLLGVGPAFGGVPVLVDTLRGAQQSNLLGDFFGDHVDANGKWLIVGAPLEDADLALCGGNGRFGAGISAANGIAVIADPCDATGAPAAGVAHVYEVGSGSAPLSLVQTLPNPVPSAAACYGSNFAEGGQSVATDGERILIGTTGVTPDRNVDYYTSGDTGFSLKNSIASPEPSNIGAGHGQSVNFLGKGQLSISRMGPISQGGGAVYIYDTK